MLVSKEEQRCATMRIVINEERSRFSRIEAYGVEAEFGLALMDLS